MPTDLPADIVKEVLLRVDDAADVRSSLVTCKAFGQHARMYHTYIEWKLLNECAESAFDVAVRHDDAAAAVRILPRLKEPAKCLHDAATNGAVGVVRALIPLVDVNAKAEIAGDTALHIAARLNHVEIVHALLGAPGINVNATNSDGDTAAHEHDNDRSPIYAFMCRENKSAAVIAPILNAPGFNINARNKSGQTPLLTYAWKRNIEGMRIALGIQGIDVNLAGFWGRTPLHCAVCMGSMPIISLLLAAPGINVNATTPCQLSTPLHEAVHRNNYNAVRALLAAPGIDVNALNVASLTPLHRAVMTDSVAVAELLLRAQGVDPGRPCAGRQSSVLQAQRNHR